MQEIIEKISDIVSGSIKTVFDMLLSKEVKVTIKEIKELKSTDLPAELGPARGICAVSFSKGLDKQIIYVFEIKDGSLIIDLMLGGEGAEADSLTEDDYDALSEAFNQIIGSSLVPINEAFHKDLSLAESVVSVIQNDSKEDTIASIFTDKEYYKTAYIVDIEGFSPREIQQYISIDSIKSFSSEHKNDGPGVLEMEAEEDIPDVSEPEHLPEPPPKQVSYGSSIPNIEMIMDLELPVVIRIGETEMLLQEVLKLSPGAIIELNKSVDSYVDLVVNDKVIAKGEVIVVDSNFALRIKEIKSKAERIKSLRK